MHQSASAKVTELHPRAGESPPEDAEKTTAVEVDLGDPSLYINRQISWLAFNERVLNQAEDERWPLLERVKFLAIFASNLDEFFMIRVSGLHEQLEASVVDTGPDGLTAREQLTLIAQLT